MKHILLCMLIITGLASCYKKTTYDGNHFPGFSGSGEAASWVIYSYTLTDRTYLTTVLAAQTPSVTLPSFEASLKSSFAKETSAFSYRFYASGEVAKPVAGTNNVYTWVKQSNLRWSQSGDQILIDKNVSGSWVNIAIGYPDQARILVRFKRANFDDATTDKDKIAMEALYTLFN